MDCAGNPLLAIELARAERAGDTGESLDELVRDRLARFGAVGGEVMRWAAVLSARIDIGMLVKASGLDATAVGEAFEHAERHGMLRATEQGTAQDLARSADLAHHATLSADAGLAAGRW